MLVFECLAQIADGTGREVMGLKNLRGLGRRALAHPFLQQRVDVLAMGPAVARARLESRVFGELRTVDRAQKVLPFARRHGSHGDPSVAGAVYVERHDVHVTVAMPLELTAARDEFEDV